MKKLSNGKQTISKFHGPFFGIRTLSILLVGLFSLYSNKWESLNDHVRQSIIASNKDRDKNIASEPVDDRPLRVNARPHRRVFSSVEEPIVAAKYRAGASTHALAAEYRCSRQAVVRVLRLQGIAECKNTSRR